MRVSAFRATRRRALAAGVVVLASVLAPMVCPGASVAQPSPAARVDAALDNPARLVSTAWRTELGPALRALPEWRDTQTISGPLRGRMVVGTLRLPATVEVAADTTIVADVVEFAGRTVNVVTHGHDFRLLPVTAVRTAGGAPALAGSGAGTNGVITINTSGNTGAPGSSGGIRGNDGPDGAQGTDGYIDPNSCAGTINGGEGSAGTAGGAGGAGGGGSAGSDAGAIVVDIPAGSTNSYVLIARGGQGGAGGFGGPGGNGGRGGDGGHGGFGYLWCDSFGYGGNGGNGGKGGDSGPGGKGGNGGGGGRGGNVNIVYPPGYDRSLVTKDLSGGPGGSGGSAGSTGSAGFGGSGGVGGPGQLGSGGPGWDGFPGRVVPGEPGSTGGTGNPGQETTNPVTTVRVDKATYLVGESPVYTVTGPPNTAIFWSSTRDGVTVENRAFYGQSTDGVGRWSGPGPAWIEADAGRWVKQVHIGTETGSVSFEVRRTGPWAQWSPMGGGIADRLSVTEYPGVGQVAFGRGLDSGVWFNLFNAGTSTWSGWQFGSGYFSAAPAAVTDGAPYVFGRGLEGSVFYTRHNGFGLEGWRSLGGFIEGVPSVVSIAGQPQPGGIFPRYLMVVARAGGLLYANRQVSGDAWTGWQGLGGQVASDPVIVTRGTDQADVYVRNTGGGLSTIRWQGTGWGGWQDLGGSIKGNPDAVITAYGSPWVARTFVFARGSDDSMMVYVFDGGSSSWQSLGGTLTADPAAFGDSILGPLVYVTARGTDGQLWLNRWFGAGWQGWTPIGGQTVLPAEITPDRKVLAMDSVTANPYYRFV